MTDEKIQVGVAGLGYWGPNLARNFAGLPGCQLRWVCDGSEDARARATRQFPGVRVSGALDDLLGDPELDAIVLATPVPTHADLAVRVLEAGKHCFVEKPLAQSVADAERAVAAARTADRVLMVGHLLEYHPGVLKLKELADSGELGQIYYIYGNRLNLGKLRADENALWSLGAHDVSVVLALAGEEPTEAVAHGESYVRAGVEDVVFCYLRFPSGLAAHLHLSWLDPHKERRFTVVGDRRWRPSMTWRSKARSPSTTRALTRRHEVTGSGSPAMAIPTRHGCRRSNLCGSSVRSSWTASSSAARRAPTGTAGCAWYACSSNCRTRSQPH